MNGTQGATDLDFGFRLIADNEALAQTHWLIFESPEEYEHDDHPPKGPDDNLYAHVFTRNGRDFFSDSRVRGCEHRIIRLGEWPEECRAVTTRLWHALKKNSERKALRTASHKRKKRKLQITLSVLLFAPAVLLMLFGRLSLISLDQFNYAFQSFCYVGAGLLGALLAITAAETCSGDD